MSQATIHNRVDELLRTGTVSLDQAIAMAVTEDDRREDPFIVARNRALGGSK